MTREEYLKRKVKRYASAYYEKYEDLDIPMGMNSLLHGYKRVIEELKKEEEKQKENNEYQEYLRLKEKFERN